MAVAVGDIDGDGWADLFTGNYGANQLWRNRGDGSFEEATAGLAEEEPSWTTSAVFCDFDGDGLDDLYIVNYVRYSTVDPPNCYATSSRRDYCGPSGFSSQPDRLLRNTGTGVFEDITAASGVGAVAGSGLGADVLDVDGDGRLELYVSNDGQPNFLWRRIDGRWVDDALLSGIAVNRRGEPEASMGIAVGDPDRDGDEDLVVAHLAGESHTLYVNQGNGLFDDRTRELGLAAASLPYTGFGIAWLDLEHDGWLDLAVVNGAVRIQESADLAADPYPLGQPNQLFANRGGDLVELPGEPFSAGGGGQSWSRARRRGQRRRSRSTGDQLLGSRAALSGQGLRCRRERRLPRTPADRSGSRAGSESPSLPAPISRSRQPTAMESA